MKTRPILFSGPLAGFGYDYNRLIGKFRKDDSGCWVWTASTNSKGYGRFLLHGAMTTAHRAAHLIFIGPVVEGNTVDHLCRNRACVNPAHLESVPHAVNLLRGDTITARAAAATHCPAGHPYDERNTGRKTRGGRVCRQCGRIRSAARYVRTSARNSRGWLSDDQRAEIKGFIARGHSHSVIAAVCGVSIATVSRVRHS